MTTRKLKRRNPYAELDATTWAVLNDQELPPGGDKLGAYLLTPLPGHPHPREVWEQHQDTVLASFTRKHVGCRPSFWWIYSAPEPRKRVVGVGTPLHETETAFQNAPAFRLGVPDQWTTKFWARFLELHVPMIDADNPPTFESQAHYLRRLGLLTSAERKALRPAAYEPESIFDIGILTKEDLNDDD